MIKKEMSIKRCLIAASMAGTMVLSSIPAVPVFAAETVKVGTVYAQYNGRYDSLYVFKEADNSLGFSSEEDGDVAYRFYTTKKPTAKSIPSSEKWTYLKDSNYLDLSSIAKKGTYYFATTPNPSSLKEIVSVSFPAKAAAPKVKYAPKSLWVDSTKESEAYSTRKTNAQGSFTGGTDVEYKVDGWYDSFYSLKDVAETTTSSAQNGIDGEDLESFQENGAKLIMREKSSARTNPEVVAVTDATDTAPMTATITATRPSKEKTVKIAKRATGPAVKIDYVNHTLTLKKGSSVTQISDYDDADEQVLTNTTGVDGWKTTDKAESFDVTNHTMYAVKTAAVDTKKAASAPTFVSIASANASFKSTGATVAIVGEYEQPAVMYVQGTATAPEAFQYAITDKLDSIYVASGNGKKFSYSGAKTLKWKNLKTKGSDKLNTVNLTWKNISGKYVVIRKAAVGSAFSSNVVIFKAPASATGRWTFLQQHELAAKNATWPDYSTASADAHRSLKMYVTFDKNEASKDALKVTFNGGENIINTESGKALAAELDTSAKITVKLNSDKKATTPTIAKDSLTFDAPETASTKALITFPAKAIKYTINGKTFLSPKMTYELTYTRTATAVEELTTEAALSTDPDDVYGGKTVVEENPSSNPNAGTLTVTFDENLNYEFVSNNITKAKSKTFTLTFNKDIETIGSVSISNKNSDIEITCALDEDNSKVVNVTCTNTNTSSNKAITSDDPATVTVSGFVGSNNSTMASDATLELGSE